MQGKFKTYSYSEKQDFLTEKFLQVSAAEFYRDLFPVGSFERPKMAEGKPNGIVWCDLDGEHVRTSLFYDDLERLFEKSASAAFSWLSPVGFFGKRPTSKNASLLFAMPFDLDGVGRKQIGNLFHQISRNRQPLPTYVVNSGNGLHLFYVFEKPIPLYPQVHERLNLLKRNLTRRLWNIYTSDIEEVQYQGVLQGFRTVGTKTKNGDITTCFRTGEKITLEYLNAWATDEAVKVKDFKYKSELTLAEAKAKYPDWYEKRIVQGDTSGGGAWHPKGNPRALYDWWLRKIHEGATYGHRYWCVFALVVYGRKCGVPLAEIRQDAYALVDELNDLNEDEPFTKKDVRAAFRAYQESNYTVSRQFISEQTAIEIKANKRRKVPLCRKDGTALKAARAVQKIMNEANGTDWRNKDGRPSYREAVFKFLDFNPNATDKEFCELTGMSRAVFFKYKKLYHPDWQNEGKSPEELHREAVMRELKEKYSIPTIAFDTDENGEIIDSPMTRRSFENLRKMREEKK